MNTKMLIKVRKLWNNPDASVELNRANMRKWVKFDTTGIAQGTAQAMFNLTTSHTNDSLNIANPPVMVNITEWGAPTTGFMAGYFSGNFVGSGSTNYTISGSFRTRRRSWAAAAM